MNSWCESCAKKGCCYTMEIRPKCYVATTNTASGTPESYLAKSLRYSQDSHEIAKDEQQTERGGRVMSMISEIVDRLRAEAESMGKYGVDYMATLLTRSADTIVMLSEKARGESQADWYWRCPKCDHIVPNEFDECVWCLEPKPMKPKLVMPKKCKGCDSASKIIEAYSRGWTDGAEAVKAMPQMERDSK